jgi:hypothetical protein
VVRLHHLLSWCPYLQILGVPPGEDVTRVLDLADLALGAELAVGRPAPAPRADVRVPLPPPQIKTGISLILHVPSLFAPWHEIIPLNPSCLSGGLNERFLLLFSDALFFSIKTCSLSLAYICWFSDWEMMEMA